MKSVGVMRSLLGVLFIGFCILCSCYAQTQSACNNPIYNSTYNCLNGYCLTQKSLLNPAPKPRTSICPDISFTQPSCCSSALYPVLANQFSLYAPTTNAYASVNEYTFNTVNVTKQLAIKSAELASYGLDDDQLQSLLVPYSEVVTAQAYYNKSLVLKCNEAALKYQAGMVCLSCRPDYAKYIYYNSNTLTLVLDLDTCQQLQAACSDYVFTHIFKKVADLNLANGRLTDAIKELRAENYSIPWSAFNLPVNGVPWTEADSETLINMGCPNKSCSSFVCSERFIQGLYLVTGLAVASTTKIPVTVPGTRRGEKEMEMEEESRGRRQSTGLPVTIMPVFRADGYAAYQIGSNSSLFTAAAPLTSATTGSSGSILLSWIQILF